MMLGSVFTKTLRDNRKSLFWWGVGLFVFTFINLAFYPDFKDQTEFNKLLDGSDAVKAFAPNVTSFTAPEGYLNSQLFALMAPIMLVIFAVTQGTAAIAGEENRKTLPLLIANPVSRERIVIDKFQALVVGTAVLTAVIFATLTLLGPTFELHIAFDKFVAIHLSLFLLATTFGSLALLAGSAWGNRAGAAGIVSSLVAASYLAYTLAPLSDAIEPFKYYSPFYYYFENDPITNGLDWGNVGILVAITLVTFGLAILAFRRRDVRA